VLFRSALTVQRGDVKAAHADVAIAHTDPARPFAPAHGATPFEPVAAGLGSEPSFVPQRSAGAARAYSGVSEPVPARVAVDSGRAQPLFIALRTPQVVRVGEPFNVEITGESENDFARVAVTVQFDPATLRVADVRQGDLMAQRGAGAAFSYDIDAQGGRVSIQFSENEGGIPVSGGGTFCTIELVATASGRVPLSIDDVAVGDLNNERVAYSVVPPATVLIRE